MRAFQFCFWIWTVAGVGYHKKILEEEKVSMSEEAIQKKTLALLGNLNKKSFLL